VNGYYKSELIYGPARTGPWKTAEDVELATLGWVHWHNTSRLHGYLNDIPPAELKPRSTLQTGPTNTWSKSNSPSLHHNTITTRAFQSGSSAGARRWTSGSSRTRATALAWPRVNYRRHGLWPPNEHLRKRRRVLCRRWAKQCRRLEFLTIHSSTALLRPTTQTETPWL